MGRVIQGQLFSAEPRSAREMLTSLCFVCLAVCSSYHNPYLKCPSRQGMAILRAQRARDYGRWQGPEWKSSFAVALGCSRLETLVGEIDSHLSRPTSLSSHSEGAFSGWTKGKPKPKAWDPVMIPVEPWADFYPPCASVCLSEAWRNSTPLDG